MTNLPARTIFRAVGSLPARTMLIMMLIAWRIGSADGGYADGLAVPTGEVVLTITGNIGRPNVGTEVQLDLATLQSLPVTEFTTTTAWSDVPQHFSGVRMNVLFDFIGSSSSRFVARGLDDYRFTVDDIDFDRYPVIIAYRQDGELIPIRQLGPLRIVMPFDEYPELRTKRNESSSVWQLVKLELL